MRAVDRTQRTRGTRDRTAWRWLSLCVLALGLLVTRSANASEPAYLRQMPTPAQVKAKVKGKDPLDTAARQYGAFSILRGVVDDFSDGRVMFGTANPAEHALWITYGNEANTATSTGLAILKGRGLPTTGFDSPSPTWTRLSNQLRYDPSLRKQVFDTFLTPELVTRFDAIQLQKQRDFQASRAPVTAGGTTFSGTEKLRGFSDRFMAANNDTLRAIAVVIMVLLSPFYLAVAAYRSLRVAMWPVSGPVTSTNKWSESHTHTTPGVYNPQTGLTTGGSSRTTTYRYDQFFIYDGARQHTVTLRDANFPVAKEHRVTAVWAGKNKGARSWYVCRVFNHSTGQGQNVYDGLKWARGRSGGIGLLLTFAFFCLALLGLLVTGNIAEGTAWETVGTVALLALPFWIVGSILIRILNLFLDQRLYSQAKASENGQRANA